MPWPVPSAKVMAERLAAKAESAIAVVQPTVDPVALSRAVRSARGMLATLFRTVAMELREVHDHLSWWGRQYFVDTAEDEFVLRHASIWGVPQRPATFAVGTVLVEGVAGTALPADLELTGSDGVLLKTTAAIAIELDGTVLVPVIALVAGPSGNIEAGIRLVTTLPFPEISRLTVVSLAGGAAEETPAELAQAVLRRIRQPPHGGAAFDYPAWLRGAFDVRAVRVVTDWVGRGSVGVIVVMRDGAFGRAPTGDELDAMLEMLGPPGSSTGLRPVTAYVAVVAGVVTELDITVRIRPDTVVTRAAVTAAFERYVATIGDEFDAQNTGPIGARIEPSRISEAISAASGEYAHDLIVPAAPYTLAATAYPVPGTITFEDPL